MGVRLRKCAGDPLDGGKWFARLDGTGGEPLMQLTAAGCTSPQIAGYVETGW